MKALPPHKDKPVGREGSASFCPECRTLPTLSGVIGGYQKEFYSKSLPNGLPLVGVFSAVDLRCEWTKPLDKIEEDKDIC